MSDASVAAILAPAVAAVEKLKAQPIGVTLLTAIERGAGGESALGNLFSDAFRESVPGADLAINNTFGGLRADLPSGVLTYGDLFRTYPFDNRLVTLRLTGGQVRRVASDVIVTGNRVPGLSGLRVRAVCGGGGLEVQLLRPSGAPVRDDETLVVVTTDFIALSGDRLLAGIMPPQGFAVDAAAPIARDVVADALRRRGGQLRGADLIDAANPRWIAPAGSGACRAQAPGPQAPGFRP
jgi:2',3'-cyclic-nucleotide 2'-phosphodiesterase (5'-nucleotidase family)